MNRNKLSISPSKLEQYRKFFDEEYNGFITEEMVIETITGVKKYKPEMITGEACHAIIENGPEQYFDSAKGKYVVAVDVGELPGGGREIKEEEFTWNEILPLVDYRNSHPGLVFEVFNRYTTFVKGYEVEMQMYIDAFWGTFVHEHKTVYKPWEMETYERSLQWKVYLLATLARKVTYNIFYVKEPLVSEQKAGITERTIRPGSFDLYPYPQMQKDVHDWLYMFIDFCEKRGLLEYVYADNRREAVL